MAKRCTVYGPRRPDDMDVKDFLDFARSLERARRQTEGKTKDNILRDEEWKKFSERFNDPGEWMQKNA